MPRGGPESGRCSEPCDQIRGQRLPRLGLLLQPERGVRCHTVLSARWDTKKRNEKRAVGRFTQLPDYQEPDVFLWRVRKTEFYNRHSGFDHRAFVAYQQAALGVMQYYGVPENHVSAAMLKTLSPSGALQGTVDANTVGSV